MKTCVFTRLRVVGAGGGGFAMASVWRPLARSTNHNNTSRSLDWN